MRVILEKRCFHFKESQRFNWNEIRQIDSDFFFSQRRKEAKSLLELLMRLRKHG
ncbi:hypothetical protein HMPREF9372_3368 [Sporosarcina newyorkensis 2681]|uniref:Uncharacterized protein n=1 Tax=Sporosarcina newyorkensis 2681 TaxID=1027292 RepID=F9DX37_9BACL|nr:hypothetical protein HMPREF9372_3368 [Sporosarcina newyorkensis 2681]